MNLKKTLKMATMAACATVCVTGAKGEIKILLCTGDYGMWAQDRAKAIQEEVQKAAPDACSFEVEQAYNFVRKLEEPGYARRFDVIVAGDIALGQMTTRSQEALVEFVENGGGFVYVIWAKSSLGFNGSREVEPLPLVAILPCEFPDTRTARGDASAIAYTEGVFKGLSFSGTPLLAPDKDGKVPDPVMPMALERKHGRGNVFALYGVFGSSYRGISYAKYEKNPGGWDEWPQAGECWGRILKYMAKDSPVLDGTRASTDAKYKVVPCVAEIAVDATKAIDDVRAANFSIVALQQLYNEDGGNGEADFLELNPQDWFDRRTQEVLGNTAGKWTNKPALFRHYNIKGIIMAGASYGSHSKWDEAAWDKEVKSAVDSAKQYPDIQAFLQPGNEPHPNQGYYDFYNKYAERVLKEAPDLKVIGPGYASNLWGPSEKDMIEFIEVCGKNTDVLNWHIYARAPDSVVSQVKHWSNYADGKLRTKGPAEVMFTEADAWNTRESQYNYLLDRAFTFLPEPEIIGTYQYCMRPRYEGGTYWFGVLHTKPDSEFAANYNGYWIFRNLRGKLVETKAEITPAAANANCHVLSSVSKDGETVTVVAHYDTGYLGVDEKSPAATFKVNVKLPEGKYTLERSDGAWNKREVTQVPGEASGEPIVETTLEPSTAVAWTWRRK